MKPFAIAIALVLAVVALVATASCKKKEAEPARRAHVEQMPAAEVQRSQDACEAYVQRVCACAAQLPAVVQQCQLARALPDAVRIGLEVAASPDIKPEVVSQSIASVRKTAKECIEQTAQLPSLGCP
jgi:hypothetical protein